MSDESRIPVHGPVVEEQIEFTLVELSRAVGADEEQITTLIVEGVIDPIVHSGEAQPSQGEQAIAASLFAARAQWRFSGAALRRARLAMNLARDLEVNPPGVALALDLIDEIQALRAKLHRLGR
ncbi:MAG: chaperone modulator CbpM [Burkholderiaceae bacterium]|nr:chaperone modulator CbpM [Burkholderiaceae bacterium]